MPLPLSSFLMVIICMLTDACAPAPYSLTSDPYPHTHSLPAGSFSEASLILSSPSPLNPYLKPPLPLVAASQPVPS